MSATRPKPDVVNHPPHYTAHPSGVECITITEHMGFNLGNAFKYIWRADLKHDAIEDLKKARWYLDRELAKRDPKPPKPKGKKKTFFRGTRVTEGGMSYVTKLSNNIGSPHELLVTAYQYAMANPGSILEIVVRKPAKEEGK